MSLRGGGLCEDVSFPIPSLPISTPPPDSKNIRTDHFTIKQCCCCCAGCCALETICCCLGAEEVADNL